MFRQTPSDTIDAELEEKEKPQHRSKDIMHGFSESSWLLKRGRDDVLHGRRQGIVIFLVESLILPIILAGILLVSLHERS